MNLGFLRTWIAAALVAGALTGCGHFGGRTAQKDPFLDDTRYAAAPGAASSGPPGMPPKGPPGSAGPQSQTSRYRQDVAAGGITRQERLPAQPLISSSKQPGTPAKKSAGLRDARDLVDPFLTEELAKSAAPEEPKAAPIEPAAEFTPAEPELESPPAVSKASRSDDAFAPQPPTPGPGAEESFPTATRTRKPAAERSESANPFEEAESPAAEEAPLARATERKPRPKAAPFPESSDETGGDEEPIASHAPKPRSKPAPRATASVEPEEESPFGAPAPRRTTAPARTTPSRLAPPPNRGPENPLAVKAPFPPRTQTPDEEEFEENPFQKPPARRKAPVTVAAEEPESEPMEEDDQPVKIRVAIPSVQQTEYEEEPAPREKPTAYRRRYRPMPSPAEAGWKARDDEEFGDER